MSENSHKDQEDRIPNSRANRRFVTLRAEHGHKEVDLEMPSDQPIGEWMSNLIKILNWPPMDTNSTINYRIRTASGRVLSDQETLNEAGIQNYDVLWISLIEPGAEADEADFSDPEEQAQQLKPTTESALEASESDQHKTHLSITGPSLVSNSGSVFVLGVPPILIGRRSSKHRPNIDLTELDKEHVSSRRHAMILKEGDYWTLLVRITTNGTLLNGVGLSPGDKRALKDGDVIQFGSDGVELTFYSG